ncbi:MAG: Crp/Fnr family transcriptional regulator [Gammaproteobacteria bacterium]|nr:Crp/Fnr family transcriptional regulator [Gammaproteobacteria bacterium]
MNTIEHVPLFDELNADDIALLSRYGIERKYRKHTIVVSEGDCSDSLYIIKAGRIKVFASEEENSKDVTLSTQGPGEFFGELALIDEPERSASVVTLEDSVLVMVTRPGFSRCIAEHSELSIKFMRSLVKRIRSLTLTVKNLALLDVYGRITRLLLELADDTDGSLVIEPRVTHGDIAKMVGSSREMVSRIMKDLANGGYILVEQKRILIQAKFPAHW